MVEADKVPLQEKYKEVQEGDMNCDKKIVNLSDLKELTDEDLILFINTSSNVGKMAFGLMRNAKSLAFPEGSCNTA